MVATWEGSGSTPDAEILWPRYSSLQLCDAPHALLTVDGEPVILLSCRALPHMACVLLVVPAADDYSISSMQAKATWQSLMALSTSHWKDGPAFLRPKGILLYSNRPKGRFSGHSLG